MNHPRFNEDHLIPHITKKNTVKEMFDALVMLYQSVNMSCKIPLKNKLTGIRMRKTNTIKELSNEDHKVERSAHYH